MDYFFKLFSLCLVGCLAANFLECGQVQRLLMLLCSALGGLILLNLLAPVREILQQLMQLTGVQRAVFTPVLKAVGIGIFAQFGSAFCRENGEPLLAQVLELGGVLAIMLVSLPLISAAIALLQTLIGE